MKSLVDNSLLHLYFTVVETPRIVPVHKRNEILVRYLKPKLKDNHYRQIKRELRNMLSIGRNAKRDLEAKLVELRKLHQRLEESLTDAQKLFDLLEILRCEQGLESRFINENERRVPGFIYMLQEHGFNQAGEQVSPVSLFLESDKVYGLVEAIELTGLFGAELQQLNQDKLQGHILLHPINA
ncbi:Protein of unknown function (DUF2913) [Shewanella psychrophila]|uniref:DUF2913 family protein n=2 Tax=Shewanella psychrophila TaxID=225848 RepID=A0A1S6HW58_9GAMM|nr:Protein of unknown function (DUF2913) [Shewanella psychrophila]